jgi:hypothetical protein
MTDEQKVYVRAHYADRGPMRIAQELGISRWAVQTWGYQHGLKCSPATRTRLALETKARLGLRGHWVDPDPEEYERLKRELREAYFARRRAETTDVKNEPISRLVRVAT